MGNLLRLTSRLSGWAVGLAVLLGAAMPQPSHARPASAVWLAPLDDLPHPRDGIPGAVDFEQLFAPGATWPESLKSVRVFKIYGYFATNATDAEMTRMIRFLREHGIKLALEAGPLSPSDACGQRVEGYNGEYLANIATRIKTLGGKVDILAMDEPLWFGRFYDGDRACHADIEALARNLAVNVAAMKKVMPDLQVGDVEPGVGPDGPSEWAATMTRWADAVKRATGKPLAFIHLDVNWFSDWTAHVSAVGAALRRSAVPYGIIYNGTVSDEDDAAWAAHATSHYLEFERMGRGPDVAIFQTWKQNPTHVLPPGEPRTLTGLVRAYERTPSEFGLRGTTAEQIVGRLTTPDGAALAHRPISLEVRETDPAKEIQALTLAGTVPENAVTAMLAIRLNAECHCSGAARLAIQGGQFKQDGRSEPIDLVDAAEPSRQDPRSRSVSGLRIVEVSPGQAVRINSKPVSVVAGHRFSAVFRLGFTLETQRSGLLAVIFLDRNGKEIARHLGNFEPAWLKQATAITGADGGFSFPAPRLEFTGRLSFPGDEQLRPAFADLRKEVR